MIIYESEKVMPYVYMGIHKITGQFYFGSRYTKMLCLPSHLDLMQYKTSSKFVKPIFDCFDWVVLAEFFDSKDAFVFEQQLIQENWDNPLKLNNWYCNNLNIIIRSDESKRRMSEAKIGKKRKPHSAETIVKMTGKVRTAEFKANLSQLKKNTPRSPEHVVNLANANKKRAGISLSDEHKAKISNYQKGRPKSAEHRSIILANNRRRAALNKGKPSPLKGIPKSETTKANMSAARKRYLEKTKSNSQ